MILDIKDLSNAINHIGERWVTLQSYTQLSPTPLDIKLMLWQRNEVAVSSHSSLSLYGRVDQMRAALVSTREARYWQDTRCHDSPSFEYTKWCSGSFVSSFLPMLCCQDLPLNGWQSRTVACLRGRSLQHFHALPPPFQQTHLILKAQGRMMLTTRGELSLAHLKDF